MGWKQEQPLDKSDHAIYKLDKLDFTAQCLFAALFHSEHSNRAVTSIKYSNRAVKNAL